MARWRMKHHSDGHTKRRIDTLHTHTLLMQQTMLPRLCDPKISVTHKASVTCRRDVQGCAKQNNNSQSSSVKLLLSPAARWAQNTQVYAMNEMVETAHMIELTIRARRSEPEVVSNREDMMVCLLCV